ncbi:hypothetical protein V1264_024762 [Littorina saxatilis]|uniref:Uncharacterized protein n=1 Tax=Littorina saxatilis TaxID=31220 RepID=A0AAN9FYI2_9CAEN
MGSNFCGKVTNHREDYGSSYSVICRYFPDLLGNSRQYPEKVSQVLVFRHHGRSLKDALTFRTIVFANQ